MVVAVSTTSLGVDYTLRDALTVEVRQKVNKVEAVKGQQNIRRGKRSLIHLLLEKQWSVLADTLRLIRVRDGNTIRCSVKGFLAGGVTIINVISVELWQIVSMFMRD